MDKRAYRQFCGVAKALDLVGERWTLLLVRDLLLGPRRYSDLLEGLPGLTTNLLAKRLKTLVADGLVEQRKLAAPAATVVYALTELGRQLEPTVLALGAFGAQFMDPAALRPNAPGNPPHTNPRWAMVSLKRRFVGSRGTWQLQLRIDAQAFWVRVDPNHIDVRDGLSPSPPDVTVWGPRKAWMALLFGAATARELVASAALQREGSARALADFARSVGARP